MTNRQMGRNTKPREVVPRGFVFEEALRASILINAFYRTRSVLPTAL